MSELHDQTQLVFYNCTPENAKKKGYPTFNECNHYTVDMSHLKPGTDDWMNTISVKLPNGNFVTFCVMQTSPDETCVDTKFHGENLKDHRVMTFGGSGEDYIVPNKNIYALIAHAEKIE